VRGNQVLNITTVRPASRIDLVVSGRGKLWCVHPREDFPDQPDLKFKEQKFAEHATHCITHWTEVNITSILASDFEVFSDPCYFDMWCLRPIGSRDFNATIHFGAVEEAQAAGDIIRTWAGRFCLPPVKKEKKT